MNGWMTLWTVVLIGAGSTFALLTLLVAVAGFFDILAMFRTMEAAQRDRGQASPPDASSDG